MAFCASCPVVSSARCVTVVAVCHVSPVARLPALLVCQDGVTGSTVAFRALQEKMIELDKVAIVRMIMREGSAPRFCALLAQVRVHAPPASLWCLAVVSRVMRRVTTAEGGPRRRGLGGHSHRHVHDPAAVL